MKTQGPFYVDSPAKVTLYLRILRRRSDGYHDVRIALVPIALYDRLWLHIGGAAGVHLREDPAAALGPPERNLVVRAARAFESASGIPLALELRLEKHVPVGAGLGGGSGNAAAVLVALNRWHGHPVGPQRLQALAAELGADVPFFLEARPAWAEGVGDRLTVIGGVPALHLLVVQPPLAISTGEAYALARAEADGGPTPDGEPQLSSTHGIAAGLFNAFESALFPRHSVLGRIKAALIEAGAAGSLLSGSGSAVFGVFADAARRDAAQASLAGEAQAQGWRLLPCHTLPGHRYDLVY